jgi:hypothetical protein
VLRPTGCDAAVLCEPDGKTINFFASRVAFICHPAQQESYVIMDPSFRGDDMPIYYVSACRLQIRLLLTTPHSFLRSAQDRRLLLVYLLGTTLSSFATPSLTTKRVFQCARI